MQTDKRVIWILLLGTSLCFASLAYAQQEEPGESKPLERRSIGESHAPEADETPAPEEGQTDQQTDTTKKQQTPRGLFDSQWFLPAMLGGIVLLYVWMGRSRRKQESKRKEMIANLKKGDKVTSIGGIIGTIIEVREDEITVKVDETNNVRMRFVRSAIRGLGKQDKTEETNR